MKTIFSKSNVWLAVMGLWLAPNVAAAQFASDSSAPTTIDADDARSQDNVMILTGQVDIRQGDTRLLADRVDIYSYPEDQSDGRGAAVSGTMNSDNIERVVATGNFYYLTGTQEVRGEKGVYTDATDSFLVTGNVIMLQDGSVVTGERLDYNLETGQAEVGGTCKGRKCPNAQRVRILLESQDNPAVN